MISRENQNDCLSNHLDLIDLSEAKVEGKTRETEQEQRPLIGASDRSYALFLAPVPACH